MEITIYNPQTWQRRRPTSPEPTPTMVYQPRNRRPTGRRFLGAHRMQHRVEAMKYRLYHGTDAKFTKFDSAHCGKGTGAYYFPAFWFTDNEEATHFFGQNIIVAEITMYDPLIVSSEEFRGSQQGPQWWAAQAYERGHDGLILQDIVDGYKRSNVHAVWDDEQIEVVEFREFTESLNGEFSWIPLAI